MSLKRMLNDDEDVYYPPAHSPFFPSPTEGATFAHSFGFPRSDMVSPSSTGTDPIDFIPDVPAVADDLSSLGNVAFDLLSSGFGADSLYNLDEDSRYIVDQDLERWAENISLANGTSSPTQETPTSAPSLIQNTTSRSSSATAVDEGSADRVCYGMVSSSCGSRMHEIADDLSCSDPPCGRQAHRQNDHDRL